MDWIWFHPFARNRGKLKFLWPKLRKEFGVFSLTKPLSPHMAKFMEKYAQQIAAADRHPATRAVGS
jgi:hypothetical protein